jgi:eukaryotic-like serine/threonine-protein kinase
LIGQSLAHYRVTCALGAGGMGEVYRATDTKLGREVALKLLASLNHPGIAHLYGFERATTAGPSSRGQDGLLGMTAQHGRDGLLGMTEQHGPDALLGTTHFLVMELVDGEDLAERLKRGPVAPDEAVAIAKPIAEALEAAHERGIVHRDLKPANVKVTPDGGVKVLDFGLSRRECGEDAGGRRGPPSRR